MNHRIVHASLGEHLDHALRTGTYCGVSVRFSSDCGVEALTTQSDRHSLVTFGQSNLREPIASGRYGRQARDGFQSEGMPLS